MSDKKKKSKVEVLQLMDDARHRGPYAGEVYIHYASLLPDAEDICVYKVLHVALSADDCSGQVVYQDMKTGVIWTRPQADWHWKIEDKDRYVRVGRVDCT